MATKFYLPNTGYAADVTPSNSNYLNWNNTDKDESAQMMYTSKKGSTLTTTGQKAADTTAGFRHHRVKRFVSQPLAAQTISGTISGFLSAYESNSNFNGTLAIGVYRVNSSGTVQDILLNITYSDSSSSPYELPTSISGRAFYDASEGTSISLTSRTFSAGDRLVVEIGYAESGTTTTRYAYLRFGDSGTTDISAVGDSQDYNPWIQFSANISFESVQVPITGTVGITSGVSGSLRRQTPVVGNIQKGMNLEVHLSINDWGFVSATSGETPHPDQRISLNTNDYDGDVTYYFETNSDSWESGNKNIYLCRGDGTVVATNVTTPGEWFPRVSNSFTPTSGNDEYYVKLAQQDSLWQWCGTAKIVIVQKNATKTRLQIPLTALHGGTTESTYPSPTISTTNTSYNNQGVYQEGNFMYTKDTSNLATIDGWVFEACLSNSTAGGTSYAILQNNNDGTYVTASEVSKSGTAYGIVSANVADNATNFHEGDKFEVWTKSNDGSNTAYLHNARLYVKLSNVTKIKQYIRMARASWSGTGFAWLHEDRFLYTASNWSNATFKNEIYGFCNQDVEAYQLIRTAQVREPTDATPVKGSQIIFNAPYYAQVVKTTPPLRLEDGYYYMGTKLGTPTENSAWNSLMMVVEQKAGIGTGVTGSLTLQKKVAGTVGIQSTISNAPLSASKKIVGSLGITSNVPNAPLSASKKVTGAVAIQSNVPDATLTVTKAPTPLTGTVGIQSNVPNAPLTASKKLVGSLGIQSGVPNAPLSASKKLVGSLGIQSNVPNAPLSAAKKLVGSISLQSYVAGSITDRRPLIGLVGIQSGVTGALSTTKKISGTVGIQSTSTGTLSNKRPLVGSVAIQSGATATVLTNKRPLVGSLSIQSNVPNSTLTVSRGITPLTGTVGITSNVPNALLSTTKKLIGNLAIQSGVPNTSIQVSKKITGTVGITSTATATLKADKKIAGTVTIQSTATGTITNRRPITGSVAIVSNVPNATLTTVGIKPLTGAVGITSGVSGGLSATKTLTGAISIQSNATALLVDREEYRKNFAPANMADCSNTLGTTTGWNNRNGGVVSSTTEEKYFKERSIKVVTPGAATLEGTITNAVPIYGAGRYTAWIMVKAPYNTYMGLQMTSITPVSNTWFYATGGWDKIKVTVDITSGSSPQFMVRTGNQEAITFYVGQFQLEMGDDTKWRPGNLLTYNQSTVETDTTGLYAAYGTLSRDTNVFFEGRGSAKNTVGSSNNAAINIYQVRATIKANTLYKFRIRGRANVNKSGKVYIRWYDSGGAGISNSEANITYTANQWDYYEVWGIAPSNAVTASPNLELTGAVVSNEFYWDNAWFNEVSFEPLTGSAAIQTTVTGTRLGSIVKITGSVGITSTSAGSITLYKKLTGSVGISSSVTGSIIASKKLTGSVTTTTSATGSLSAIKKLIGTANITTTASASLSRQTQLTGLVEILTSTSGTLQQFAPFYDTWFVYVTNLEPETIVNMLEPPEVEQTMVLMKNPITNVYMMQPKDLIDFRGEVTIRTAVTAVLTIL